jgi:hypothetical protein
MGTSTRIPGPRADAGPWRAARRRLRTWQRDLAATAPAAAGPGAAAVAEAYLQALADHLRTDPAAFGLKAALEAAGVRLAVVLPRFVHEQHATLAGGGAAGPAGREPLRAFADRVAGDGALVVDSAVRRAATRAGAHAVTRLRAALDPAGEPPPPGVSPPDAAFCAAYAFFFADAVRQFLVTLMAEQEAAAPGPHGDPVTLVGDLVTARVSGVVPDPCAGAAGGLTPAVLGERAASLVDVAVRRVLGLPPDSERAA